MFGQIIDLIDVVAFSDSTKPVLGAVRESGVILPERVPALENDGAVQ